MSWFINIKPIQENIDNFPLKYLIGGAILASLIFTHKYSIGEIVWSFSLWLEAVSILPQLYILQKLVKQKILLLIIFLLLEFIVLYIFQIGFIDILLKVILILFLYWQDYYKLVFILISFYYTKVMKGKKFELPV